MTIVFAIGLFVELLFIIRLEYKVCANESGIFGIDSRVDRLTHDIKGSEEAIKVLSDSVRKLNGVVKDLEQKQPKIEPKNRMNTRVFIAGWDADETEPEDPAKKHIVDIGTYEQKQDLIDVMAYQNYLSSQIQQCNYQTLQSDLLSQTQQCIYPWQPLQTGQLQSCAMLPLWYINRRLEDM